MTTKNKFLEKMTSNPHLAKLMLAVVILVHCVLETIFPFIIHNDKEYKIWNLNKNIYAHFWLSTNGGYN